MYKLPHRKKIDFKDAGLGIGLILGRYFFKTDLLHYGYWPPDLQVNAGNLAEAQANYNNFLLSHFPSGARTVLDVGCGSGRFAMELRDSGYLVDCVSPSRVLTEHARRLLGEDQIIYECRFEDLQTEKRYDVVLFSESFQYVEVNESLRKSVGLLTEGGHVLICDFFRKYAGPSVISGGHLLERFYQRLEQHPFIIREDKDITEQTAPTLDVAEEFLNGVMLPVSQVLADFMKKNYPRLFKLLRWVYRKKIAKLRNKYLSGARSAKAFAACKSYRLLALQKTSVST